MQKVWEDDIEKLIKFGRKHGISKESITLNLREEYSMEEAQAAEKVELYW